MSKSTHTESEQLILGGIYWILKTRWWQFAQRLPVISVGSKMSRDTWREQQASEHTWEFYSVWKMEILFQNKVAWAGRCIMIILQTAFWSSTNEH